MRNFRSIACLLVVMGTISLAAPSVAFSRDDYTLDEAVALVKETFGGQVLKATSTERSGRLVHRIRILTDDGRVRTFIVDAQDGLVP